ncbi:MAG: hypothetical protein EA380_09295 [Phycisphaeraceae bacterium]|nr:MAG: hypothetical protein EA380_09295 [Phycisphaeraceae bacterium]
MPRQAVHLVLPLLLAATLAGCQSQPQQRAAAPEYQPRSNAHIFPTDMARAATDTAPPERFEFARLDHSLASRVAAPLRATQQWPQAPQPLERRILFRWWEQR